MMARVCDSCAAAITTVDYYDVILTPKDPRENPEQDADCVNGDFCLNCVRTGKATQKLLDDYGAEEDPVVARPDGEPQP